MKSLASFCWEKKTCKQNISHFSLYYTVQPRGEHRENKIKKLKKLNHKKKLIKLIRILKKLTGSVFVL